MFRFQLHANRKLITEIPKWRAPFKANVSAQNPIFIWAQELRPQLIHIQMGRFWCFRINGRDILTRLAIAHLNSTECKHPDRASQHDEELVNPWSVVAFQRPDRPNDVNFKGIPFWPAAGRSVGHSRTRTSIKRCTLATRSKKGWHGRTELIRI